MRFLPTNLGARERLLRLLGAALLAVAAWWLRADGWLPMLAAGGAVVLAGTALAGFCPACALFGLRQPRGRR
ncbi:YgaP-like transmembrane domain [Pseudacidovorax intermedius]|uniref:YgaP-like transmembrane domain n=1 Tax=Pseudacidovorax intermedius TaxID=433924 RepID=UPI0026E95257|nr:YgaP-like transmembrane domain [Pseudacidovorax intermedius]